MKQIRATDRFLDFSKLGKQEHPLLDPSRDSCSHRATTEDLTIEQVQRYLKMKLLEIAPNKKEDVSDG